MPLIMVSRATDLPHTLRFGSGERNEDVTFIPASRERRKAFHRKRLKELRRKQRSS